MLRKFLLLLIFVKLLPVYAVEVSPDIGPKNLTDDERQKQRLEMLEAIPQELENPGHPKKEFEFHNRSLLGSNFTYGSSTSFDVDADTQTSLNFKKSRIENVVEYYTYYFGDDNTPTQRFKEKFEAGLKYLYEIYPHWSPFLGIKYEQTFERKGPNGANSELQSYDLGLRYDYVYENNLYLMFEVSHRYAIENSHDFTGDIHKIRGYAAISYYKKPFGGGLWVEAVAPYSDMADFWISVGPDFNYTFPNTLFFIGLTGNASWQGKADYDGDARLDVWAANVYLGFKI